MQRREGQTIIALPDNVLYKQNFSIFINNFERQKLLNDILNLIALYIWTLLDSDTDTNARRLVLSNNMWLNVLTLFFLSF